MEDDGPVPYPEYDNKLQMITQLTDRIKEFNIKIYLEQPKVFQDLGKVFQPDKIALSNAPHFHSYGF